MELAMHGNCVAIQLERAQRMGEKYWTQGGEDRCLVTRANYEVRASLDAICLSVCVLQRLVEPKLLTI